MDFDLLKGSDIEILLSINESRILSAEVFLVMTKQEFTKVFAVSEKTVHIDRLKEQAQQLIEELKYDLDEFVYNEDKILEIETEQLLIEVNEIWEDLKSLNEKDNSDRKYIIAEKLRRKAQKADRMGGMNRIEELIERYLNFKEYVLELIHTVNFHKQQILDKYDKVVKSEGSFLNSKNTSVIQSGLRQMEDIYDTARSNTIPFLIECMQDYESLPDEDFKNPSAARKLLRQANEALEKERYLEFKQNVVGAYNLLLRYDKSLNNPDFKGTGIG